MIPPPTKTSAKGSAWTADGGGCWNGSKGACKGSPWNVNGCFAKGEGSCGGKGKVDLGGGDNLQGGGNSWQGGADSTPLAEQWPDAVCKGCWSPLPSETSICSTCGPSTMQAATGTQRGDEQVFAKGAMPAPDGATALGAFAKAARPPMQPSVPQALVATPKVPAPPGLLPPGLLPPGLSTGSPSNGWPNGHQAIANEPSSAPPIPCRNFAIGTCTYGANCAFFHDPNLPARPEEVQLCRNFAVGECTYGEKCAFSHDPKKLQEELAKPKPALEVSPILCKNFQNGDCKYGAWCGYKHISNPFDLPMEAAPSVNSSSSSTLPAPDINAGPQAVTGPTWIPQLEHAIREVLAPIANLDTQWSLDEMVRHCSDCITKAAAKFHKDERRNQPASSLQAQALCGEFARETMKSLAEVCIGKAWLTSANFAEPLGIAARNIFRSGKLFARTAATSIRGFVDEALFRLKEDDRVGQLMRKAVGAVSNLVPTPFDQLALGHLEGAYDEVHLNAPWGSHGAPSAEGLPSLELGLVQDFVKGWMVEFIKRAQLDVLPCVGQTQDEQVTFVTLLFEFLTNSQTCAIPYDLVSCLTIALPEKWPFIHKSAMKVIMGIEPGSQSPQASSLQTSSAQQSSQGQAPGAVVGSFAAAGTAPPRI